MIPTRSIIIEGSSVTIHRPAPDKSGSWRFDLGKPMRVKRLLFDTMSAGSLLIALACLFAWGWSYRSMVEYKSMGDEGQTYWCFVLLRGGIQIGALSKIYAPDMHWETGFRVMSLHPSRWYNEPPGDRWQVFFNCNKEFLGFRWDMGALSLSTFTLRIPLWAPTAVFLILPALQARRLARRIRQSRRRKMGLCVNCGYDLRASPVRCPECGDAVPTPYQPPQPISKAALALFALATLPYGLMASFFYIDWDFISTLEPVVFALFVIGGGVGAAIRYAMRMRARFRAAGAIRNSAIARAAIIVGSLALLVLAATWSLYFRFF